MAPPPGGSACTQTPGQTQSWWWVLSGRNTGGGSTEKEPWTQPVGRSQDEATLVLTGWVGVIPRRRRGRTPGRGRSRTRQGRTVGGGDTESAWEATTVAFRRSPGCVRREVDGKGQAAGR